MVKRFFLVVLILCVVLCSCVFATEDKYLPTIPEDFYSLSENVDELASLFDMSKDEVLSFCAENNIVELAVSADAKKEIRLQVTETEFSKKVFDFKNYNDNELYTISLDIIGFEGVTGKIVENKGQRFIKTEIASTDKEGYSVLQYTTVAKGKYYILSFYCDKGNDFNFANDVFKDFYHADFSVAILNNTEPFEVIIPVCIGLLGLVIIATAVYLIVSSKKRNR